MTKKSGLENTNFKYELIQTKRRTISIIILDDGKVQVRAPENMGIEKINRLVNTKKNWIIEKVSIAKKKEDIIKEKDEIMFLGLYKKVEVINNRNIVHNSAIVVDDKLIVTLIEDSSLNIVLENFYREQTTDYVNKYVNKYKDKFNCNIKKIQIKTQKRRWGSCTGDNKLLFNWRLSMAPLDVLEYVVLHEMCHLVHKDHSKNFWNEVKIHMPDYKIKHSWLNDNGYKLYKIL